MKKINPPKITPIAEHSHIEQLENQIKDLERRITELERRPIYFPIYQPQNPNFPQYPPMNPVNPMYYIQ